MTCSWKSNLLLNNIPRSFWLELLVIVSVLIFNATFSSVLTSRWHLSGLAVQDKCNQKLLTNQLKGPQHKPVYLKLRDILQLKLTSSVVL